MTFIGQKSFGVGDRVRCTAPIEIAMGTFTVGHVFNVTGFSKDQYKPGWDLRDDEGNEVTGVQSSVLEKVD